MISDADFPHRDYEKQRAMRLLCNLTNALDEFSAALIATESEKLLLAKRINQHLSPMLSILQAFVDHLEIPAEDITQDLAKLNTGVVNFGNLVIETFMSFSYHL